MKRIVLAATAAAMLIAATVAFAATTPINTYKATVSFSPSTSGTAKHPLKAAFTQKFVVTPGTAGNRAGILLNTAIAHAKNPVLMAEAMRDGVSAGRKAFLAGRMPKRLYANASSPEAGLIE